MTPDDIAKGLDDADRFGSDFTCQFCDSDRNVQLITLDMGPKEGNRVFWLCGICRGSPDLKIANTLTGLQGGLAESLDDRDQFTTYKIRVICGWCKKPLGEKPTSDPKQDGKISHGMCRECEVEQYRQMGMEPPIREGLDDTDEFEPTDFCDRCNEPFRRAELTRINDYMAGWDADRVCPACLEIINQGPQDDKWLERFYTEGLDDKDEFVDDSRCERCNSTDWVEPVYYNVDSRLPNTMEHLCRWCKKALFTESLEDADEFGYVKAIAGYEEAGIDDSKHVFTFEDGARLYQDAKIVDRGYGETDVQYRIVLKLPDGSVHRSDTLKYSEQDLPPPFNVYMDGVYAFIREGDILPFPLDLLKEFHRVMQQPDVMESIAEDLDDKDDFGDPPFIQITITDPNLSAVDAIAQAIDTLKNPHSSHMNGWNVTDIEVTSYSLNNSFNRPDAWNTPSYESLENTPGALISIEGFLQHNEPRLATPELAFTDSLKGPGILLTIYVGY